MRNIFYLGLIKRFLVPTLIGINIITFGCAKSADSFSVLPDGQIFQQSGKDILQKDIDVLWVIDNSASMKPFHDNLLANFKSFITNFVGKEYNFHLSVATTDGYLAGSKFLNNSTYSKLKDGMGSAHTGFPIIDLYTPKIIDTFTINAAQGEKGSGDERAFSSLRETLENGANSKFLRSDSFLAVIILSDEDDFSDPNRPEGSWVKKEGVKDHSYSNPGLETVDSYVALLDQATNSKDPNFRKYNVSAVTVADDVCLSKHVKDAPSSIKGTRYMDLANKTKGVVADICSPSFAGALGDIQKRILELSTQFKLDNTPIPETITVVVNDSSIPEDSDNGWTYSVETNSIFFHGEALPPQGATISIKFQPVSIRQ